MEIYSTEEQQEQAIVSFIQRYWIAFVVLIIVVIGLSAGWYYYQDVQTQKASQASMAFAQLIEKTPEKGQVEAFKAFSEKYKGVNDYPAMAQLVLASKLVKAKQYKQAEAALKQAVAQSEKPVKSLSALRLARLQLQLKQYAHAFESLKTVTDKAFKGTASALKGDIYFAQGKMAQAKNAYQQALADGAGRDSTIQLKLDNLSGE